MALDKNFTFRSMTRQDYFCLYDAIHTLVRQDEITKEQVLSPHASERVSSCSARTRARPRAHTQKYRRDLCGIISPSKFSFPVLLSRYWLHFYTCSILHTCLKNLIPVHFKHIPSLHISFVCKCSHIYLSIYAELHSYMLRSPCILRMCAGKCPVRPHWTAGQGFGFGLSGFFKKNRCILTCLQAFLQVCACIYACAKCIYVVNVWVCVCFVSVFFPVSVFHT